MVKKRTNSFKRGLMVTLVLISICPKRRLKFSVRKTVLVAFHLNNRKANRKAKVNNNILPFSLCQNHFVVALEWTLRYNQFLDTLCKILGTRAALLRRLVISGLEKHCSQLSS